MKTFKIAAELLWYVLIAILIFGGMAVASTSAFLGFGYFIYNWGPLELEVGKAAWEGFTMFLSALFGGVISAIVGYILHFLFSDKKLFN